MATDPVISRALDYPYSSPAYDFVLDNGSVTRLQDKDSLAGRIPVLALGSNRSPEQLLRKFGERDVLPVTSIQLCGYDVVYAAHMASYGSIPAVLARSPGTVIDIGINWLSRIQLERMHETEAIGVNYNFGVAHKLNILSCNEHNIQIVGCYLGIHGCLSLKKNLIALQEINARDRIFTALSQFEILYEIYSSNSKSISFEVWLKHLINNNDARRNITATFNQNAIKNILPNFKICDRERLEKCFVQTD
jgi:hypothetical protein